MLIGYAVVMARSNNQQTFQRRQGLVQPITNHLGINSLSPAAMTAEERLGEVARILAAGILRARARRLESQARSKSTNGESSLDLPVKQSGRVGTKNRHGERK